MTKWLRRAGFVLLLLAVTAGSAAAWFAWRWQERPELAELSWVITETVGNAEDVVRVTWLGNSTLLFDDGDTQILIDGTFTRLSVLDIVTLRPVSSDIANINYVLNEYRMDRLAAIIPVHSHFDHAMDAGHVANRTAAVVLGSESTANIARGADVPVDQHQILASGESRHFGEFSVTLVESRHAPHGPGGNGWFPGIIQEPLRQPARISAWKSGAVYSVFVSHPRGTTLIQGSAGFVEGLLDDYAADIVMLGVGRLAALGEEYAGRYWQETVRATGAKTVFAVHFDDFTRPFGEVQLFPRIADDVPQAAAWIDAAAAEDEIEVRRLPFGIAVGLY